MVSLKPGRRGSLIRWGFAAMFCLGVLSQWWPGYVERVVTPGEMRPVGGHAFYVEALGLDTLWLFRVQTDVPGLPPASSLTLREDGRTLSYPHAQHEAIETHGHGAYSHWGDALYFSSSDNSDPRSNGRRYAVHAALVARRRLMAAFVAVLLFALSGVIRSVTPTIASAVFRRLAELTAGDLLAGLRVATACAAAAIVLGFGYLWLLDPLAAMEIARKAAIRSTMGGVWAAIGALVAFRIQHRALRSWSLAMALVALGGTFCFLFLRPEIFGGHPPNAVSVLGLLSAGALGAYVVRLDLVRKRYQEFWAAPGATGHALAATIALVFCLAAPMIWSPVVQNWNASGWMDSHGYDTYAHNILTGYKPEGSSEYMPVYQYGMAAVYYVFGHFFFAQQLINGLLAFLTIALICLSAWNLFRNLWAVLLIGVWAAFARQFVYAVFFTQIESWYMPIVAFGFFAWSSYWRTSSKAHLVMLAVAAGIGINTRNQGAFYFGWLCLAPLFVAVLPWRRRLMHAAIAIAILAASLVPWSVRNYFVDGRLSPSSARNAIYVAILNDPRIGFYGLRYWEGWGEITDDYARKYPDPVARDHAMMSAGVRTPFVNPGWFERAMFWRALAFYGLLPQGVFETPGPNPTDWAREWRGFVYWRTTPLLLLPLSLLGLLTRPGRTTLFLAGAVLANVLVTALTGGAEDRVSYPVLPLHMLMALAAIFPFSPGSAGYSVRNAVFGAVRARTWIITAAGLVVFVVFARTHFGRPNLYAPQAENAVAIVPDVALDSTLTSLNDFAAASSPSPRPDPDLAGRLVRMRLIVLNYQCPPKFGGRIGYVPDFATEPQGPTYYYAYLLVRRGNQLDHVSMAVTWFGAVLNQPLREGDEVEAEGRLMLAANSPIAPYWVRIEKARKVVVRSSEIPPFK